MEAARRLGTTVGVGISGPVFEPVAALPPPGNEVQLAAAEDGISEPLLLSSREIRLVSQN